MNAIINPHDESAPHPLDVALAEDIGAVLTKHYPGHPWAVHVDRRTGIATVENWSLSTRCGFVMKMDELDTHDAVKRRAIQAGGEFLERFGLARGKADRDEVAAHAAVSWKH